MNPFRSRKNERLGSSIGASSAEQSPETEIRTTKQVCNDSNLDLITYNCCTESYVQILNVVPDIGERGIYMIEK